MASLSGPDLIESSTPSTPPTGRLFLYPKSDHKIYIKDSTGLETQIGAQGPQGIQGIQGPTGATGSTGPQGATGNTGATGSQGPAGNPGALWYTGSGAPSTGLGIVGDFYLNSANGDYYSKTGASVWTLQGNIKGPAGATGSTGSTGSQGIQGIQGIPGNPGALWYTGVSAPAAGTGIVGDFYLNSSTGDYYSKTGASTWTLQGNLKGPQGNTGSTGSTGSQGATGAPGSKWYTTSGAPSGASGVVGDWSLDTVSGDYYEKTGASAWTLRGNLKGPQGNTGSQGIQGIQGPTGATGSQGIQGVQGNPGTPGSVWFTSAGSPAGATGVLGDYYLNTSNGDYYQKTGASTWTLKGNLTGPQGIQGIQGVQGIQGIQGTAGEKWFSGSGAPATGLGAINDWYLNLASGDVYEKTGSSLWTLQGNIKGPQGVQGIQGIQGPIGNTGATGNTGAQGPQGNVGATGPTGPQGAQGVKGDTGAQGPIGQGVHAGGTAGQSLVKQSNADFDTAWVTIDASAVAVLEQRVQVLEVKVTELQDQIALLSTNPAFPGPLVGAGVHLKNSDGDCVEAVIYEDYTRRNNNNTISVVYVDPDNPTWLRRADVKEQNGVVNDVPFNNWHIPEWNSTPAQVRTVYASRKS